MFLWGWCFVSVASPSTPPSPHHNLPNLMETNVTRGLVEDESKKILSQFTWALAGLSLAFAGFGFYSECKGKLLKDSGKRSEIIWQVLTGLLWLLC